MKKSNSAKNTTCKIIFAILMFIIAFACIWGITTASANSENLQKTDKQLARWEQSFEEYSAIDDPDDKFRSCSSLYVTIDTTPKSDFSDEQRQTADELLSQLMQVIDEIEY